MISIKFSCVTQGAEASSNKLHAVVRGSHPIGLRGWDGMVHFNLKIHLPFEATLVDLFTYLVGHGDSVSSLGPKPLGHLTNSIGRIQDHGLGHLCWARIVAGLLVGIARAIGEGSDI